ncbi:MAG: hypothetical protein R2809_12990 [Flavobacteriales bacterium]
MARIYKLLGLNALASGPHTSPANNKHHKYSFHLRNLKIDHPKSSLGYDITCIPVKTGFLYLSAIIDFYSRSIVGCSLSNTMTSDWTTEVIKVAI